MDAKTSKGTSLETILEKYAIEIHLIQKWFSDIGLGENDFECYKNAVAVVAGKIEISEQLINNGLSSSYKCYQLAAMEVVKFQNHTQAV